MPIRVCFDTNAWVSILEEEPHADLVALGTWMDVVTRGDAVLLIPTIVATEVSVGRSATSQSLAILEAFLLQTYVEVLDLTTTIAFDAARLRRKVLDAKPKRTLKTPDAIVIASAMHFNADYVISTDRDVLRLNGFEGIRPIIGPPSTGLEQPGLL